jgi:mannose-6-phosphate isomerase-like protein (cupin superfamily)
VRMDMGEQVPMRIGEAVLTPAGVQHCMVNIGDVPATIDCGHGPAAPSPSRD